MNILNVEHIEKYYGTSHQIVKAIDDISFKMEQGEFCAVMGASGSGKTTLLNMVSTIDSLSAGEIYIKGKPLSAMREKELADFRRHELGFIFQDFNLLDTLHIGENIALPLTLLKKDTKTIDQEVNQICKTLDIKDIMGKYPYEVSGGQRQRCACARAMVHKPSLILADEPTGALDSHSSWLFMEQLKRMNEQQQATILMVTHDAFSASYAKRVLFLKDGRIFNEIYCGDHNRNDFYQMILDVMMLLGGDVHAVR